ncbi:DUF3450 domain-containing protein [Acinetobacter pittii]|uniref:DUF3450 domain-containing protein n=1 Tax=Acinetobacter pittii TaxID=48296 RepID=UPI001F436A24|nr:DUF3450 domain-containing protein [Acinetobacter pittii]MCE6238340.1 DUF3450 domain-containing protein [Acinetobacter pittii]MCE6689641.1 DUF3450 domain-containing protein [Acinetobacter pittii]MCE6697867.1 DUF3450 domain-containing protein [Acinetobacter pittii]
MDYPKMLYKGDLVNFEYATADSEEHEEDLKEGGWIEHHELEEPVSIGETNDSADEIKEIDLDAYVPVEQFDAVAGKLVEAEEQLAAAKKEFHSRINELQLEKQKLEEELKAMPAETGVPQEVFDAVHQEREQLLKENAQYKYSAMSAAELRTVLDGKGIKYGSRDEKPALVKLVLDNQ